MDELVELERQGWETLSSDGDAGQRFYASILHQDAVMLFPGGMRIVGRDQILESLGSQPWKTYRIEHAHVISLAANAAALVYHVTAQREASPPYVALVSSTYVRDPTWKLVLHQQTPA